MNGLPYKDTLAAKGSALYQALAEGRENDAKRLYAETSARFHATQYKLAVPSTIYDLDKEGKPNGKWRIESSDSRYDNNGRFKENK